MNNHTKFIVSTLLLVCLFGGALTTEIKSCTSDAIQLHYLPEPLRVIGKAVSALEAAQVVINLSAETLEKEASDSLTKNSKIINNSIAAFKSIGLEEAEFSTQGLSVNPSYTSSYDQSTNQYKNIFEGYKVRNSLIISTKKMALAGKIIDAAVINGVTHINSIQYSPLGSKVIEEKEKLLAEAVLDAKKQAEIIVKQLDYVIQSVKTITVLENYNSPRPYARPMAKSAPMDETSVFASTEGQEMSVEVSFIIAPKA